MLQVLRWLVLLFPGIWLLAESFMGPSDSQFLLWIGAGLCFLVAALLWLFAHRASSIRLVAFVVPLTGYLWLLVTKPAGNPLLRSLTESLLILLPIVSLLSFWFIRSGALMYRRARLLSKVLSVKTNWPSELSQCKELTEVAAFRETIQFDASPALDLLDHAHPAVRVVALAALEQRMHWRIGQVERILRVLEGERVPEVRVAAVAALANVRNRRATEGIAILLSDQDESVRKAACQSLFMKAERRNRDRRWTWMRNSVRHALSSAVLSDAPLLQEGQLLSDEAVADFVAWVADRGILGVRAASTLATHFSRLLREDPETTSRELIALVEDPHTPAILRIQLAKLLSTQYKGDLKLMEKLLFAGNPVPLRQMAAETLLIRTGRHPEALNALREIARLGNREIALDTARIVQQCLNIDLGLAVGQAIPHPGSPRAADITRKLLQWAMQSEPSQNAIDLGGTRSQFNL